MHLNDRLQRVERQLKDRLADVNVSNRAWRPVAEVTRGRERGEEKGQGEPEAHDAVGVRGAREREPAAFTNNSQRLSANSELSDRRPGCQVARLFCPLFLDCPLPSSTVVRWESPPFTKLPPSRFFVVRETAHAPRGGC